MEALSKQPVTIVIEADQFCYRLNTNRAAERDEFEGDYTERAEQESLNRSITNSCGSSLFSFEYHCGNFKNDLNRTNYMSYRASLRFCSVGKNEKMELVYRCRVYNLIETPSMDDEGNMLKKTDSTCIFRHDVLSLLQGEVSFKMSVIVKSNSDLFSEALPDESGEDEVLLLHTSTCQNEQIQNTVEAVGGAESVNNAWKGLRTLCLGLAQWAQENSMSMNFHDSAGSDVRVRPDVHCRVT